MLANATVAVRRHTTQRENHHGLQLRIHLLFELAKLAAETLVNSDRIASQININDLRRVVYSTCKTRGDKLNLINYSGALSNTVEPRTPAPPGLIPMVFEATPKNDYTSQSSRITD